MFAKIENDTWQTMSQQERNHQLYLSQCVILAMFLERGAISQAEHDRSLSELTIRMGEMK